jgi:hypothetical protein
MAREEVGWRTPFVRPLLERTAGKRCPKHVAVRGVPSFTAQMHTIIHTTIA